MTRGPGVRAFVSRGSAEFTRDPCLTEARYWHAGLLAIDTRSRNQNPLFPLPFPFASARAMFEPKIGVFSFRTRGVRDTFCFGP
jgi:hypothetical protein